jgi:DNA-binding response OmpR family regulator
LRLRRKLEVNPSAPRVIQTERGVGYTFALPVEPF